MTFAGVTQDGGRSRVAGDHQHLDAAFHEGVHDAEGQRPHLGDRAGPVGGMEGVADVQQLLMGQLVQDRPGHGESADARVEDADGTFGATAGIGLLDTHPAQARRDGPAGQ
jgi:hypothetical protein